MVMTMRKITSMIFKKFSTKIVLVVCPLFITLCAQAATLDDVVNRLDGIKTQLSNAAKAFVALIYEPNPNNPATVALNIQQPENNQLIAQSVAQQSLAQIKQSLAPVYVAGVNYPQLKLDLTAKVTGSDSVSAKTPSVIAKTEPSQNKAAEQDSTAAGDDNFNFSNFITPMAYNPQQRLQAAHFITYVSGLADPLSPIQLNDQSKATIRGTEEGWNYLYALRTMMASQSVALTNLDYLFAERQPIANLATTAGLKTADGAASKLQLQQYIATRRTDSEQWYKEMAQASPTTVAREQLNVLAEIERQLYQLHTDNEKILATLSVMEIQTNAAANKTNLQTATQNLCSSNAGKNLPGCPKVQGLSFTPPR